MKGLMVVLLAIALFFSGALYGIDKNQEKENGAVETNAAPSVQDTTSHPECDAPVVEEDIPWISQLAGGIGEGVAVSFNGIVLILSEVLSAGS
ncbi:hypothetical protein H0266_01350 [Halobacillus locisalis]|uniref:Uncharacterized protein n=1 Tax=Halobacillus locisalis TaxID=220753 RepID=A0A838CNW4_9BACI|nr:hypothetical protein [Halobacillus locisalis]MBA2173538.1 hypothetical protein [Halobacillus locisalis]